ncbi:MAG TPA: alpha-amylase family protein, partial [Phycisphaerae bacterium]|nr:alpha-amylase family protein [Phycisphaerae bacterium]
YEVCFSPTCLDFYRAFLKKRFDAVEVLNLVWGMNFASWEDVTPIRRTKEALSTIEHLQADLTDGEMAMWVSHRLAMDEVFLQTMQLNADIVHKHDPGAHVGCENFERSSAWWGYCLDKMLPVNSTLIPSDGPAPVQDQIAIVRSFRREDSLTGGLLGGYLWGGRDATNEGIIWNQLFNDADVCFWWYASGAAAALGADLAPTWLMERCIEPIRLIRGGLGKFVRHTERLHDGIAILYSRESVCATGINDDFARSAATRSKWGAYSVGASRAAWQGALEELGLQYEYVTGEQAATLDPKGEFKVLVLPYAIALSSDVVAGIESFVKRGGTVLADVRPGVYDELGMRQYVDSLDSVFGISRIRTADAVKSLLPVMTVDTGTPLTDFSPVRVDGEVRAWGAKAFGEAGGVPIFLLSSFGEGQTVLLNFLTEDVFLNRIDNVPDDTVTCISAFLAMAGVTPVVKIETTGKKLKGLEVVRLRGGKTDIVGLLRETLGLPHPERKAVVGDVVDGTLEFGEALHTYDVRKGAYLGEVDHVAFSLERGTALVLARLPYAVSGIVVQAKDAVRGGRVALTLELKGAPSQEIQHVVRMEVRGPDGKMRPWMTNKLLMDGAKGETNIPIAWNDPLGKWTLLVTDVATNVCAERAFRVLDVPTEKETGQ